MKLIISLIIAMTSTVALAGSCVFKVHRTPCPGKDSDAFKPFGGANPSTEAQKKLTTLEACKGELASREKIGIDRIGTVNKREITALFDGKEIGKIISTRACK